MIRRVIEAVAAHFAVHWRRRKAAFLWRVTLEGILVSLTITIILGLIFSLPGRSDLGKISSAAVVVKLCLFSPIVETLLLQALPVMLARIARAGIALQITVSVIVFAAAHFPAGIDSGVVAGILGGFYLAFTFVRWREESLASALTMTVASHAIHNTILVFAMILLGIFAPPQRG